MSKENEIKHNVLCVQYAVENYYYFFQPIH